MGEGATGPMELAGRALAALLFLAGRSPLRRRALPAHSLPAHSGPSNCGFQEPVGLGASKAEIGPSEDRFCRIRSTIAPLWVKKAVKNGPLRPVCSRRLPSPTGS